MRRPIGEDGKLPRKIDLPPFDGAAFAAKYGTWAVIAGASEGTGACFAEQLAGLGINLVLMSRRQEALDALAAGLTQRHGVACRTLAADLMEEGAGRRLVEATADLDVGLYISNAGSDGAGSSFFADPVERSLRVLTMNAANVLEAVHGFGGRFLARGKGGIIVMSSGAGLGGQPWLAMYSGTKAFEVNFVESLWTELEDRDVDILAMAAPMMDTPTLRRATAGLDFDFSKAYDPAEVCALALASLGGDPLIVVPDGPDEHKLPQLQADRKTRLCKLAEWGKSYTAGVKR